MIHTSSGCVPGGGAGGTWPLARKLVSRHSEHWAVLLVAPRRYDTKWARDFVWPHFVQVRLSRSASGASLATVHARLRVSL